MESGLLGDADPTQDPEVCGVLERPGTQPARKPQGRRLLMRLSPTGWMLVGEGGGG